MRFEGKNVLVTGGSSGIGRATVLAFAREGARVIAAGRDVDRLADVKCGADGNVETTVVDMGVPAQVRRMVREAVDAVGRLHVLVNNAAVVYEEPVLDISEQTWDETLAVNLSGPFWASQAAAAHMAEAGGGAIVNVASTNAIVNVSPYCHYNASKAGLTMMTQSFAHELGHLGVRANCVAPGQTITPMGLGDESEYPAWRSWYYLTIPQRRAARPGEQAAVILFLASDDASYINGQTIVADGGLLAGTWVRPEPVPPVPQNDDPNW